MENKVNIVNTSNSQVVINYPQLRFKRVLERKGSRVTIDKEIFTELLYSNGFMSLIKKGILYVEDMEVKKEAGLEPDNATEPVNIIVLTDKQKERLLKTAPFSELKETCEKLHSEQLKELVSFAIANEINMDMNKLDYLQAKTGKDILKAIQLNRSIRAEEAKKNDSPISNL